MAVQKVDYSGSLLDLTHSYADLFYPQDWYIYEPFARARPPKGVYVFGDTNAPVTSPPAVICAALFINQLYETGKRLWATEYVWTSDTDSEGNRVYVGGFNKGFKHGFQIHRHLANPVVSTINCRLDL